METVDAWIPLFEQGWKVDELQVSICPREEQSMGPYGLAVDIRFDDMDGKTHLINDDARVLAILADIKKYDTDKWAQIELAARQNSRPDYEDSEPVSYAPHYAEDAWPTTTFGR